MKNNKNKIMENKLDRINVVRTKSQSVLYGYAHNGFGMLQHCRIGKIKLDTKLNCYFFEPAWNLESMAEKSLGAINKEIEYLKKQKSQKCCKICGQDGKKRKREYEERKNG